MIQERLAAAKAAVVIWSADAAASEWVRSEANRARRDRKLVQLRVDGAALPMPFDQIQCADLRGWNGEANSAGWRKVVGSVAELIGSYRAAAAVIPEHLPPALPDKPSIAVLPFADMSVAKDQDYFCDGMVAEITTALTRFPSLFVIASGSSLSFRDDTRDRKKIARELGVRYLLEGNVRRSTDRVRIGVELVDALDGIQIWAERFDGKLDDVFALQDTVAAAVASQIEPTVRLADIRRAIARPTGDLTAYELYLRAIPLYLINSVESRLQALDLVDEAIVRDPDYAAALALAASLHSFLAINRGNDDPAQSRLTSLELGRRAIQCGGDDPEVLAYVSYTLVFNGEDIGTADAMIERALALNPGIAFSWYSSGIVKLICGRPALGLEHWQTALRLDPRSMWRPYILGWMGVALFMLRRFEEAVPLAKEGYQLRPENGAYLVIVVAAYGHLGRLEEAALAMRNVDASALALALGLARDPEQNALLRSGLALAGVET